jgi:hypothetical protein
LILPYRIKLIFIISVLFALIQFKDYEDDRWVSALNTEAVYSSEILAAAYSTTRRYHPEDLHRFPLCEILKTQFGDHFTEGSK